MTNRFRVIPIAILFIALPLSFGYFRNDALAAEESSASWDALMQEVGVLYREGNYELAFERAKQALDLARELYGEEHENVATSLHNLAEIYRIREEMDDAKDLYRRAIALYEKIFGVNSARLTAPLNNLAYIHVMLGENEEAEAMLDRVLEIGFRTLGWTHPRMLTYAQNAASYFASQGNHAKAIALYEKILLMKESQPDADEAELRGLRTAIEQLKEAQLASPAEEAAPDTAI
ncbi:MAG: tetratricopeptide repeat protein [Candidatus Omnitrophota bacterium]|nr:tetratricopeptide repeat protein [Candidatus Omnitrophota bacterium]